MVGPHGLSKLILTTAPAASKAGDAQTVRGFNMQGARQLLEA
jgi:hypothetical protein